jgi:hypothetical protein
VRAATQLDSFDGVVSAAAPVVEVVELEEAGGGASPTAAVDVSAPTLVALPDGSAHRGGDVPGPARWLAGVFRCARTIGRADLRRQGALEEQLQRARDDHRRIAIRYLVGEEILQLAERRVRLLADRHADLVPPRRQRLDHGRRRRAYGRRPRYRRRRSRR